MPRDGSGVYSKPAGTTAVAGTTIESAKYNSQVDDMVADLNAARPITAGGTGGASIAAAQTALSLDNKVVYASKSGNYTALATDNNAVHRYTAAATVTLTAAATLAANWHYSVIADGGDVIIDPNASETINGFATITVPDGSTAEIICDGTNFFTKRKPSGWESIGVYNPSAVTSFSITNLGSFRFLRATGYLIPSVGNQLAYRTSSNNGSSYDSGASDYVTQTLVGAGATAAAAASTGTAAFITTQTTTAIHFELILAGFNVAAFVLASSKNYTLISGGQTSEVVGSQRSQSTARNALQFLTIGGATISGRLHLEGIKG